MKKGDEEWPAAQNADNCPARDEFLTLRDVEKLIRFSKSKIYAMTKEKEKQFPLGVKIGRARRWRLSDIQKWMANRD